MDTNTKTTKKWYHRISSYLHKVYIRRSPSIQVLIMIKFQSPLHEITQQLKIFTISNEYGIQVLLYKIYISGYILNLPSETRYLSFVIFYQYLQVYQKHYHNKEDNTTSPSLSNHPIEHLGKVAAATIFLACKVSNESRRIRDVINLHKMLQFSTVYKNYNDCNNNEDERQRNQVVIDCHDTPPPLDEEYWQFKEEIVKIEHHLLRVLNFDIFQVIVTPYRIVISIIEEIITRIEANDNIISTMIQDQDLRTIFKHIIHTSWRRLNDALLNIDTMILKNSELACAAIQHALIEEGYYGENKLVENMTTNGINHSIRCQLGKIIHEYCWWEWVDVNIEEFNKAKSILTDANDYLSCFQNNNDIVTINK